MAKREVQEMLAGRPASDGDGVRLTRVFGGGGRPERFDPWLMMDEFGSDQAADYIGGFPSHPHRGFETITYMLDGHMEHQDHMGNVGDLQSGDVQWMTAGSGIIHSEMPKQKDGLMRGFQIWLNLPARDKMQPPSYRDIRAREIPRYRLGDVDVRAIAGILRSGDTLIEGADIREATDPAYLDVRFAQQGQELNLDIPDGHTVLVYCYEGGVEVGERATRVEKGRLARLTGEGRLHLSAAGPARIIVLSGRPLKEAVAQYGPFVMNTTEEVEQALRDYRDGRLVTAS